MATALFGSSTTATKGGTPYDFSVKDIDGKDVDLSQYKGKAILVVNVASQCGEPANYHSQSMLYGRALHNLLLCCMHDGREFRISGMIYFSLILGDTCRLHTPVQGAWRAVR